jgi:hypothetical protein
MAPAGDLRTVTESHLAATPVGLIGLPARLNRLAVNGDDEQRGRERKRSQVGRPPQHGLELGDALRRAGPS